MLLSPIYEQIFYNFSMGFTKGRSQHQAIHNLREWCRDLNINWIISADITGLFDNINHEFLKDLIRQKVNDLLGKIAQRLLGHKEEDSRKTAESIYEDAVAMVQGSSPRIVHNI